MRRYVLASFIALLFASAALAQEDNSALADKLNRLERDVTFLQKQVYNAGGNGDGVISTAPNAGQTEVRFSQINEELRQIRGQIEQAQFQQKQTADTLKKLSDDVDYRLRALEQKQAAADSAAAAAVANAATPAQPAEPAKTDSPKADAAPATYQPDTGNQPALTGKDFPNANAHYSFAFDLLNKKKYSQAAASFDAFVHEYPGDPLVANAYYWLGESYYARSDNTRAAEAFRKGFEANPEGQKAPDNLYKLALSLNSIKRTGEACIVLNQVVAKYADSAPRTTAKAVAERTTLQCK
ncbi:MAG: tol-pal system protein YbgF [Rickettsiales bacterium]